MKDAKVLQKTEIPQRLRTIGNKIENLYLKGNSELLSDAYVKLAIVGSRRMTEYGKRVIEKWMPTLVQKGIVIVSGFMYGVDQAAHQACIENGGKTIAVLGWGIDRKVAGEDEKLYQKILEVDSLIVSEYEGEYPADRWTFPARNRIVAGLSDAVLVIEAAERSGSLITARLAKKYGKILLAVPGQVTSSVAMGTNSLIKDGKAVMVRSAEDILKEMNLLSGQLRMTFPDCQMSPLMEVLRSGPRSADELARISQKTVSEVMEELLTQQLEGVVEEKNGVYTATD